MRGAVSRLDCWLESFTSVGHVLKLALQYVYQNAPKLGIDPGRIAVGGTSSGGNLAACMAIRAGAAIPLQFVVLGVPVCDNTASGETYPSWAKMENAPGLPAAKMLWCKSRPSQLARFG